MKSTNAFLFSDGSAKLGDFNVSKVTKRGLGYIQKGSPYYASPEIWKEKPYDNKSDLFILGCVLYKMITLRLPFRAQNTENFIIKFVKDNLVEFLLNSVKIYLKSFNIYYKLILY